MAARRAGRDQQAGRPTLEKLLTVHFSYISIQLSGQRDQKMEVLCTSITSC